MGRDGDDWMSDGNELQRSDAATEMCVDRRLRAGMVEQAVDVMMTVFENTYFTFFSDFKKT